MKRLTTILFGLAVVFVLSFALSFVHPFGNPRATSVAPMGELLEHGFVPPGARAVLRQKCADCHSDETEWPWYGRFAPASWLVERDITEAHKAMNLSQWESRSNVDLQVLKRKIVEQTGGHEMPPIQYRLIHRNTGVTEEEVTSLTAWAKGKPDPVESAAAEPTPAGAGPGDATKGKEGFRARCVGCHSTGRNLEGPKLAGMVGRTSGTVPGFKYSGALKKAGLKWDEQSLDKWLTDPDGLVPGNDMEFHVAKAEERRNIVAYLKSIN